MTGVALLSDRAANPGVRRRVSALAMLAVLASQALHVTDRNVPQPLSRFLDEVRSIVLPVDADRVLGPELAQLSSHFTRQVFAAEQP